MNSWIKGFVSNYFIDGFCIDVVKYVNDEFLFGFVKFLGVFVWGEVLMGEIEDFCCYQILDFLFGMFNYFDYYKFIEGFNGGFFEKFVQIKKQVINNCNDIFVLGIFVENYDMFCFVNKNSDMVIVKNVMIYVIFNDGVFIVYQGQEQYFNGFEIFYNCEFFWQFGYDKELFLYKFIVMFNKVCNYIIKFDKDYVNIVFEIFKVNDNYFCIKKGFYGSQIVYCIINNSFKGGKYMFIVGGFQVDQKVVEVFICQFNQVGMLGIIDMKMNNGVFKVYVFVDVFKDLGICEQMIVEEFWDDISGVGVIGVVIGFLVVVVVGWVFMFFV